MGYKRILQSTRAGLLVAYACTPAHTDERAAAETMLAVRGHGEVCRNKSFLEAHWSQTQRETRDIRLQTPVCANHRALPRPCTAGSTAGARALKAPSTQCSTRATIRNACGAERS